MVCSMELNCPDDRGWEKTGSAVSGEATSWAGSKVDRKLHSLIACTHIERYKDRSRNIHSYQILHIVLCHLSIILLVQHQHNNCHTLQSGILRDKGRLYSMMMIAYWVI